MAKPKPNANYLTPFVAGIIMVEDNIEVFLNCVFIGILSRKYHWNKNIVK